MLSGSALCPQNVSFDISTLTGTAILLSDSLAAGMYPMSSSAAACLFDPSLVSLSSHPRLLTPCRMPPLCPLMFVQLLTLSPAVSTRCHRVSLRGHQPALCPAAHVESPWVSGGAGGWAVIRLLETEPTCLLLHRCCNRLEALFPPPPPPHPPTSHTVVEAVPSLWFCRAASSLMLLHGLVVGVLIVGETAHPRMQGQSQAPLYPHCTAR
jgi:hypothetical protein